jgi:hypothetical protein
MFPSVSDFSLTRETAHVTYLEQQQLNLTHGNHTITPITVAERSRAWTVFACSDPVIMGSNPTSGMDFWCLCYVCIFLCSYTGKGLATSWSPVQGVLPIVLDLVTEMKWKVSCRRERPKLGCRAKENNNHTMPVETLRIWIGNLAH